MPENKITVHVVMQAHLDPVWLWPLTSGLDEAVATCRTACDLLDEYSDFIFTSGEAWRYWQIEQIDPALFARVQKTDCSRALGSRRRLVASAGLQPAQRLRHVTPNRARPALLP